MNDFLKHYGLKYDMGCIEYAEGPHVPHLRTLNSDVLSEYERDHGLLWLLQMYNKSHLSDTLLYVEFVN